MINSLTPLDFGGKKYLSAEEALAELAKCGSAPDVLPAPLIPPASPVITPHQGFHIEYDTNKGLFVLHTVVVEAGKLKGDWVVGWGEELLDGGKSHTQDDFVSMTKNADLRLCPGPLYDASIDALWRNQNIADRTQKALVDKLKGIFVKDFRAHYMMSSSRGVYLPAPGVVDKVVHNYGYYPDELTEDVVLVGPDGVIDSNCGFEDSIAGLLGTRQLVAVKERYEWLTGKTPKLWRINNRPKKDAIERVLVLGCDDYYFGIVAYVDFGRSSRGAVARRA